MPFSFTIITLDNVNDPSVALMTKFTTDANGGMAGLGASLSFDSPGDVSATITGNVLGDDNAARLQSAVDINGKHYAANSHVETDYSFITFDGVSGLYFRVSHITIENDLVGAVVSKGFDLATGTFPEVYTPGRSLDLIDPDTVPDTPEWNAFIRHEDFNTGKDELYDNDIDLFDDAGNYICFTAPTRIEMADGREKPAGEIKPGEVARLASGATAPVRWVGKRRLEGDVLRDAPALRPILIRAGALGAGLPRRDLRVSRQHRMLVRSAIAERMFGAPSVLVAAIRLTELPGIEIDESVEAVEYVHLLFDRHEVVLAEGAPSESLYTGEEALKAVGAEARRELMFLFPAIMRRASNPAAPIPCNRRQKRLLARHAKNARPILGEEARLDMAS